MFMESLSNSLPNQTSNNIFFACSTCGCVCQSEDHYMNHYITEHLPPKQFYITQKNNKIQCKYCQQKLSSDSEARLHILSSHSNLIKFSSNKSSSVYSENPTQNVHQDFNIDSDSDVNDINKDQQTKEKKKNQKNKKKSQNSESDDDQLEMNELNNEKSQEKKTKKEKSQLDDSNDMSSSSFFDVVFS